MLRVWEIFRELVWEETWGWVVYCPFKSRVNSSAKMPLGNKSVAIEMVSALLSAQLAQETFGPHRSASTTSSARTMLSAASIFACARGSASRQCRSMQGSLNPLRYNVLACNLGGRRCHMPDTKPTDNAHFHLIKPSTPSLTHFLGNYVLNLVLNYNHHHYHHQQQQLQHQEQECVLSKETITRMVERRNIILTVSVCMSVKTVIYMLS